MTEVLISNLTVTVSPQPDWVMEIEGPYDNYQLSWENIINGVGGGLAVLTDPGSGLSGGGTLESSRSLVVDINSLTIQAPVIKSSYLMIQEDDGTRKKVSISDITPIDDAIQVAWFYQDAM